MSKIVGPLAAMVRKLTSHTSLEQDDLDALLALPHRSQTADPGTILARKGEDPTECAVLLSGFALRQKQTDQGMRQIVSFYVPGDALDFDRLFLDAVDERIYAVNRVELAFIPQSALRELTLSRPSVARAIVASILVQASISREWMLNNGRREARSRVAHLLCEFAVRFNVVGEEQGYDLPISQEQMADVLGLTPVHVSRTLKHLAADRLIKRVGRRITFPHWDAVCEHADFSSRYLHHETERSAGGWIG